MSFIKIKKVPLIIGFIVLIAIVIAWNAKGSSSTTTVSPVEGDLVRTVELSGKVVPINDVDLAFEVGGTVAHVYKKVGDTVSKGDILVDLDTAGLGADLLKAEADLEAAKAELAKLSGGKDLQAKIINSKTNVIQNIIDAYTTANDAVLNKVDQFIENPRTQNPKVLFAFKGLELRDSINTQRIAVGEVIAKWKTLVSGLTVDTYTVQDLENVKSYVRTIGSFLDDVALAVNGFEVNPSLTQTTIDKYRTDISTARNSVNTVASALITSGQGLTDNVSDVPVQLARVSAAEANVTAYRVRISKMSLYTPFDGVVSKQDAKLGQSVAQNSVVTSVISPEYKIEAYVPEVSVAGVAVGAKAQVSLDAYGKDVLFDTVITSLEPRETIRDGVSTYKIELAFSAPDTRIRSGMTSNISIETLRKNNVLLIPARAVITKNNIKYVSIQGTDDAAAEKVVETGDTDSRGNIEITSGLTPSDLILLNPAP